MKKSVVKFDGRKLAKQLTDLAVTRQTERLIAYAEQEIQKLGDRIASYNEANHLDRTGNLLNSLCWGVTYNGEMKGSGFYRSPITRNKGLQGGNTSFLHEFFNPVGKEVNGRKQAEKFIQEYKGLANKWTVFFAILADYWGYWEQGFTMRSGGGESGIPRSSRFMKWQAMVYVYRDVRTDLKPAKTNIEVYVPKYSYKARSNKGKKYKNRKFITRIGKDE